jgi:hypothetical protein
MLCLSLSMFFCCALLMFSCVSLLCFIGVWQCFLAMLYWYLLTPPCCALLVLFGFSNQYFPLTFFWYRYGQVWKKIISNFVFNWKVFCFHFFFFEIFLWNVFSSFFHFIIIIFKKILYLISNPCFQLILVFTFILIKHFFHIFSFVNTSNCLTSL